jgi:hypothetical protein
MPGVLSLHRVYSLSPFLDDDFDCTPGQDGQTACAAFCIGNESVHTAFTIRPAPGPHHGVNGMISGDIDG